MDILDAFLMNWDVQEQIQAFQTYVVICRLYIRTILQTDDVSQEKVQTRAASDTMYKVKHMRSSALMTGCIFLHFWAKSWK